MNRTLGNSVVYQQQHFGAVYIWRIIWAWVKDSLLMGDILQRPNVSYHSLFISCFIFMDPCLTISILKYSFCLRKNLGLYLNAFWKDRQFNRPNLVIQSGSRKCYTHIPYSGHIYISTTRPNLYKYSTTFIETRRILVILYAVL